MSKHTDCMPSKAERLYQVTALGCGLLLLAGLTLWAAESAPASETRNARDHISSQAAPAVVSLFAVGQKQQAVRSRGTGFLISADGILVTARHVCAADQDLFAFTANGQKYPVTGFYGEDRDYDVAVLKVEAESMPHLVLADARVPQTNQWVAVVSRTEHGGVLCSNGVVRQVIGFPNVWEIISTSIPVQPGQSGSPVLDQEGKVVGVVSAMGGAPEQTGSAMPAGIVRRILERAAAKGPVPFAKRPKKGSANPLVMDPDFRAVFAVANDSDWSKKAGRMKAVARKYPESPVPLLMLGVFNLQSHSWKAADVALAKALKLNPDFAFAWAMRGMGLCGQGRFAEAEPLLRKSTQMPWPDRGILANVWQMLAITSAERGSIEGVREAMGEVERLDADQADKTYAQIRRNYPKLDLPVERR